MEDGEFLGQLGVKGDGFALLLAFLLRRFRARDGARGRADVVALRREGWVGRRNGGPEGVLDGAGVGLAEDFGPDVVGPVGGDGAKKEGLQADVGV